ncbi:carboxypeptidase-like regulatory domain-containing protein, partial [Phocaeicola barnesiae]|uniref:carboxypeptidase-like regulatory domain-containing protein n=1 Tax=Phocaeicola barnesiae TaxID=376804 RepID=UPI00241D4A73
MKSLWKWGMLSAFSVCMMLGTTACGDDDPDYSDVTPPEVSSVPSTIGGIVSEKSGDVIAGAKVILTDSNAGTKSTQTDTNGVYLFEDVQPGTYTVTVEAEGKVSEESTVTVEESEYTQRYIWNIALAADVMEQIAVSATETTTASFSTETLKGNEVAAVDITAV